MIKNNLKKFIKFSSECIKFSSENLMNSLFLTILLCLISFFYSDEKTSEFINQLIMPSWIYTFIWIWFATCFILICKVNNKCVFYKYIESFNRYLEILLLGAASAGLAANLFVFFNLNIRVNLDLISKIALGKENFCVTSTNLLQILLITISVMLSKYSLALISSRYRKILLLIISLSIYFLHYLLFGLCKQNSFG